MTDARSPKITLYVEPEEHAMIGDRPGPRLCKGIDIDGIAYYMPADAPVHIATGFDDTLNVTVTFMAHEVNFEVVKAAEPATA